MPFNSHIWRDLQDRAAAQLSPHFADNVIRAARTQPLKTSGWFTSPWIVSAATATVCLLSLMAFHAQQINETSARHLADWQDISTQTASLEPAP